MAISINPFRTSIEPSPPEPPKPPPPYPGPEKWKNPLWLGFFDRALGGVSTDAGHYETSIEIINNAEVVADEAWRRAAGAGHPEAFATLLSAESTNHLPKSPTPSRRMPNRRHEARERVKAIREACRANVPPPVVPEALAVLQEAAGDDAMRVYQLAENMVMEGHFSGLGDYDAAFLAADVWAKAWAWTIEVTGAPPVPLADTGMYSPP